MRITEDRGIPCGALAMVARGAALMTLHLGRAPTEAELAMLMKAVFAWFIDNSDDEDDIDGPESSEAIH